MAINQLLLRVVSQERELLSEKVDLVTIPTASGEITVLPKHIPLISQVKPGELTYRAGSQEFSVVVSRGFVDVSPEGQVTVMVDSGVHARDISLKKAEEAMNAAHETMKKTQDQRELMMAEASLRQAMLEIKVAQKTRKSKL